MTITVEVITAVATAIITMIFGYITGKSKIPNNLIPFQNFCIGFIVGIGTWYFELYPDFMTALVLSIFSSMCAGGVYDLAKTK